MTGPDRRTLRAVAALVLLLAGLALTGCAPHPPLSGPCQFVTNVDGTGVALPATVERFGVDCPTGSTVRVGLIGSGDYGATVFTDVAYPILDVPGTPTDAYSVSTTGACSPTVNGSGFLLDVSGSCVLTVDLHDAEFFGLHGGTLTVHEVRS